jgi:hypothetical protein
MEAWIVCDIYSGVQLPVSYIKWYPRDVMYHGVTPSLYRNLIQVFHSQAWSPSTQVDDAFIGKFRPKK